MVDNLTPEQRRYCMSRIKGKNTSLEKEVGKELFKLGYRYRKNVRSLPGCPDIVFKSNKVAIFIDGDFWHGYRFNHWVKRLKPFWRKKISDNIRRDIRNRKDLQKNGWKVINIWQHEIVKNNDYIEKVIRLLQ